jgi:hypothetical protein
MVGLKVGTLVDFAESTLEIGKLFAGLLITLGR